MNVLYNEKFEENKIMIVDDSPTSLMFLEKMLRQYGFKNVLAVNDSRLAIEKYLEFDPDLLLLDLVMPHVDGFAILEQLDELNESSYLPVIVITSQNDRENKLRALTLGAQDFIGKPYDDSEVLTRINNFLNVRQMQNKIKNYNLWLEDKIRENNEEITALQTDLILRLLRAAESRDYNTGNHITRIGEYAYVLSRALGISEEKSKMMSEACKMHDIGKIGIPDGILLKNDKLSSEEWETMKTHTLKGAEILKDSPADNIRLAEEIALTHHEKWDGSGYPNGLKGEEIPLSGRIMALIDVFDALLNDRPYKKAWTLEQTVFYIETESGKHFDPRIVAVFLGNLPKFTEIYRSFGC
jgi:putative two-component system response regulator